VLWADRQRAAFNWRLEQKCQCTTSTKRNIQHTTNTMCTRRRLTRKRASPHLPIGGGVGRVIGPLDATLTARRWLDNSDLHLTQDPLHSSTVTIGEAYFSTVFLTLHCYFLFRLFGPTGHCSACSKMIPAFEMVMRAKDNVYHLECFACQQCNHRYFNIGSLIIPSNSCISFCLLF